MIGIPLMFMCLTYTGDLLADAFISGYSKVVNCIYRRICPGRLKNCLTEEARRNFEQTDVRRSFSSMIESLILIDFSLKLKRLDMYLLLLL